MPFELQAEKIPSEIFEKESFIIKKKRAIEGKDNEAA